MEMAARNGLRTGPDLAKRGRRHQKNQHDDTFKVDARVRIPLGVLTSGQVRAGFSIRLSERPPLVSPDAQYDAFAIGRSER